MQTAASNRRTWLTRRTVTRAAAIALTALLLLAGACVLTQSRLPRRAAGIYGGLFEKIRRHPQATAAICLTGVTLTWCGIGLAAALEGPSARE